MAAQRKYDWEGLFARSRTELHRGADYTTSQSSMAQVIRNNASARGVRVRLTDKGVSIVVEVTGGILNTNTPAIASQFATTLV